MTHSEARGYEGAVGTVELGIRLFGESAALSRPASLGLILTGMIGLKFIADSRGIRLHCASVARRREAGTKLLALVALRAADRDGVGTGRGGIHGGRALVYSS